MTTKEKTMVVALLFGGAITLFCQTMVATAYPAVMRDYSLTASSVQWLGSIYALAMGVVVPMNAYLLGRFNVKKLFCGGFVVFSAGCAISALAPQFEFVLAGRAVQGLAAGTIMPTAITALVCMFPKDRRGFVMGLIGLVISFAPAVAPAAAGILIDASGWRSLFVLVSFMTIAMVAASLLFVRNPARFDAVPLDPVSPVLLCCAMAPTLYGLAAFGSATNVLAGLLPIVVGILFAVMFVRRQGRLESPLLHVGVVRNTTYRIALILILLLYAILIGVEAVIPMFVQNVLAFTATTSGLTMLPGVLLGLMFSLVAGILFDRHGIRVIALVGAGLLVSSAVVLFALDAGSPLVVVGIGFAVFQVAMQLLITSVDAWGVNALNGPDIPHGNALISTVIQIGSSLGTTVVMVLVSVGSAHSGEFAGTHLAFVGCLLIALVIAGVVVAFARDDADLFKERTA